MNRQLLDRSASKIESSLQADAEERIVNQSILLGLLWSAVACAPLTYKVHVTPLSSTLPIAGAYPHEVDYELLGRGEGKACSDRELLRGVPRPSTDPGAIGDPVLYEEAKFQAIHSVAEADNLLFVRVRVEVEGARECVSVVGRGYRVRSLRTVAPVQHVEPEARAEDVPARVGASPGVLPEAPTNDVVGSTEGPAPGSEPRKQKEGQPR